MRTHAEKRAERFLRDTHCAIVLTSMYMYICICTTNVHVRIIILYTCVYSLYVHVAAVLTSVYTSLVSAPDPFLPVVLYIALFYIYLYIYMIPVISVCPV